ncbi:MAG: ornithine decarboxylase, partial [Neisseriaceae bacterium]|nr:ornithine decarboxylase [Neisseriaceae bacterium]
MRIAVSQGVEFAFISEYKVMNIDVTDFTNVCAVVVKVADLEAVWNELERIGFNIPIFAAVEYGETVPAEWLPELYGVIELADELKYYNGQLINAAASDYIDSLDPPFFQALKNYTDYGNAAFDCPGHQGGQFFRKHPTGRRFFLYFGETLFRADSCNADVRLGDLLIHEGPAFEAQAHAAKVYNADKTYFVLGGTSAANKIAIGALAAKDDLVLFDRNNHKSVHQGALLLSGAKPVYLETSRNA